MKKLSSKLMLSLFLSVGVMTSSAIASTAAKDSKMPQVSHEMQEIIAEDAGTLKTRGVMSLKDYVIKEKQRYDWIFKNHPIFTKYLPHDKVIGKLKVVDRGEEFVHAGHGNDVQKYSKKKRCYFNNV